MKHVRRRHILTLLSPLVLLLAGSRAAIASPKLEDVFKSTNDNFSVETSPLKILMIVGAIVVIFALVFVLSRRSDRRALPKTLNHRGKLMKEIAKQIHLKPSEVRQLKTLADGQQLENPLVLLLCPSVLTKAAKERPDKVDRRALSGMLKQMS